MTPTQASNPNNERFVNTVSPAGRSSNMKKKTNSPAQALFQVGDHVRITVSKGHFEKGYTPNWTEEVFVVDQVLPTHPVTYRIRDLMDEPITGSFYEQHLQKTRQTKFRVEKVLRKRKGQALVKWKGYPEKFNSWLPLSELERLH